MSLGLVQTLARERRDQGLSQRALAARLGLAQPHLARLESGRGNPTLDTLSRWAAELGLVLHVSRVPGSAADDSGVLVGSARALSSLVSDGDRFRVFLDTFDRLSELDDAALAKEVQSEPPLIGDVRYDALLAALAEHFVLAGGFDPPEWCKQRRRAVDGLWWTSDLPSARTRALATCPASFRVRGIMLDASDLDRA